MNPEPCGICGGDGRIANSFSGSSARCPSCHGTGRRAVDTGFRDVTKTKASHHVQPKKPGAVEKQQGPTTVEGIQLTKEVMACASLSSGTKTKISLEIVEHEASHGRCTQTFMQKVRKQLRPPSS